MKPYPIQARSSVQILLLLAVVFSGGITLAIVSDNWQNATPTQAYLNYAVSMNQELSSMDRMDGIDPGKKRKMILMMKRLQEQQTRMQDSQQGEGD